MPPSRYRRGIPVSPFIAAAWARSILRSPDSNRDAVDRALDAWHAELAWLRQSMTADGIPEHIQALVIERWNAAADE